MVCQETSSEATSAGKLTRGERCVMVPLLVVSIIACVIGCEALYSHLRAQKAERLENAYLAGVSYYIKKDYNMSALYIKEAAEGGHVKAQAYLGFLHDIGMGVEEDMSQAVYWYLKAAEKGDAIAQNNLGWLYKIGRGVAKDPQKAAEWFTKAADQGSKYAQKALSLEGKSPKTYTQKPHFQNSQKEYRRIYTNWGELIYEGTVEIECAI